MLFLLHLFFVFSVYGDHRDLHVLTHAFPPRRSSDLARPTVARPWHRLAPVRPLVERRFVTVRVQAERLRLLDRHIGVAVRQVARRLAEQQEVFRSEEHTSELQSLMRISYAVFCLKKKNNTSSKNSYTYQYTHT